MIAPRWRKVVRDVVGNRTRTLLVVLSITVGVVAVGMVVGAYLIIGNDLPAAYRATNPAHARIFLSEFDQTLVDAVQRMPEVVDAQGARRVVVQAQIGENEWQDLRLDAIDDWDNQRMDRVGLENDAKPPGKHELLVERAALEMLNVDLGDLLTVDIGDEQLRTLRVVNLTHDLGDMASRFTGTAYGYINEDTLEWLGYSRNFNQLKFTVATQTTDIAHIETVAKAVADKIERAGYTVFRTFVPTPGKQEMERFLTPMLLILGAMGMMSLLLSGLLVVNIINALMAQQTRQIGVMKTVGARPRQVAGMYLVVVLAFGVLAFALALPLSAIATAAFTGYVGQLMNFDVLSSPLPPSVVALEAVIALVVPLLAALFPVLRGSKITVREAITDYGLGNAALRRSRIDSLLERVRGLSRPQLISLRNTFRRKGRLALTLTTLTLASAIFVSVFSVRSSLLRTLDDAFKYWNYDVNMELGRTYRVEALVQRALSFPGVAAAEGWTTRNVHRNRPDGTESDNIFVVAPPLNTEMIRPTLLQGRWLEPTDEYALVLNSDLVSDEPDLGVGQSVTLDIDGRERDWVVVGVVRSVLSGPMAYANFPVFSRELRAVDKSASLRIAFASREMATSRPALQALEDHFTSAGFKVNAVRTTAATRERTATQFNVLLTFLALMALLLAVVGGLGLMGAMSINVLERRREIGVMRSVGASTAMVMQIVVVEGMIIGALSWLLGALLAVPLSKVLSDAVGVGFLNSELTYRFSFDGAALWLAIVLGIAALASFMPARSAARLTVREVLAYE